MPCRRSGSRTARSPARLGRCWRGPAGAPRGFPGRQGRGAGCRGHVTGLFTNTGARSEFGARGRRRADGRWWGPADVGAAASLVWRGAPRGWHTVTPGRVVCVSTETLGSGAHRPPKSPECSASPRPREPQRVPAWTLPGASPAALPRGGRELCCQTRCGGLCGGSLPGAGSRLSLLQVSPTWLLTPFG